MLNTNDEAGPTGLLTGTKIAAIVSALLLAVAVYFFVSPTNFRGKDGSLFGCGSPMSPNTSGLAKGQCNIIEGQSLHRALLFLALAVITAALGYILFGTHPSSRDARARVRHDVNDDDDDEDGEPRSARRSRGERAARETRDERDERDERVERSTRRARLGDEDEPSPRMRLSDDEPRGRHRGSSAADDDTLHTRD